MKGFKEIINKEENDAFVNMKYFKKATNSLKINCHF